MQQCVLLPSAPSSLLIAFASFAGFSSSSASPAIATSGALLISPLPSPSVDRFLSRPLRL